MAVDGGQTRGEMIAKTDPRAIGLTPMTPSTRSKKPGTCPGFSVV